MFVLLKVSNCFITTKAGDTLIQKIRWLQLCMKLELSLIFEKQSKGKQSGRCSRLLGVGRRSGASCALLVSVVLQAVSKGLRLCQAIRFKWKSYKQVNCKTIVYTGNNINIFRK